METNNFVSQPITNYQVPSVEKEGPKGLLWRTINFLIGGVAVMTILLLVAWFIISRLNLAPTGSNSWNGIVPGKTNKTEVINKLGNPQEEKTEAFGTTLLYDSGIKALPNTIIYDNNNGKVNGVLVTVSDKNKAVQYYQEMQKLGKPEKIMYSRLLSISKIYIFAKKGMTYSANEYAKMVDGIHYYQPTTLDNYLSQYGKFFSEQNPYQF